MPRHASDHDTDGAARNRLDSWKAIATYLHCGVRTVQRWEKTEGLPVRRHVHQTHATVYAFAGDIDRWREQRSDLLADACVAAEREHGRTPAADRFVGRAHELNRLHTLWSRAQSGSRQIAFVSGEIGIGKTQLVRTFIDQLDGAWIVEGHCVEQYGAGEAYLPVVEGLARLSRQSNAPGAAVSLVRHTASPSSRSSEDATRRPPDKPEPASMGRELIDGLERIARSRPVVLFLDDLHWSDWSTAELIDRLARRTDPARILIVGTYRPDDLIFRQHPLLRIQHELRVHHLCEEIQVPRFSDPEITEYLSDRGIDKHLQRATAQLRKWTGGNPLFLDVVFDHLVAQGCVTSAEGVCDLQDPMATLPSMPSTLHDIVDDRIQRLSTDERRLLEAASVAGQTFSAAVVAAATGLEVDRVERAFDALARRHQFVARLDSAAASAAEEAAAYAFLHSLYANVLYNGLSPNSRVALHRAIAAHLEQAPPTGGEGTAAELAMHWERARDFERAVSCYEAAAATALSRSADHEAHRCAIKALEHLDKIPPGSDRDRRELRIRLNICAALSAMSTMSDPQVQRAYSEAFHVSERIRDEAELVPALLGISRFEVTRGNVMTSQESAGRAVAIARNARDPVLLIAALQNQATTHSIAGQFVEADRCGAEALNAHETASGPALIATASFGPIAAAMTVRSGSAWRLGFPELALRLARSAVVRAEQLAHPLTLAFAKAWTAWTLELCGATASRELAESALTMANQLELPMAGFFAEGVLGWIRVRSSNATGIDLIRNALAFQAHVGIQAWTPLMHGWLAEGLLSFGQADAAIAAAADGLTVSQKTGAYYNDSELHGLWAEAAARLAQHAASTAAERDRFAAESEEHLCQSSAIARSQEALSFELRAAMRRVRIATDASARESALVELSNIYARFSEGFTTRDLVEARALLDSRGSAR